MNNGIRVCPPSLGRLGGRRFFVFGLGRAGTAMAGFLLSRGATVFAFEENRAVTVTPTVSKLKESGMRLAHGSVPQSIDWAVVSPGVSEEHPVVRKLYRAGVPVVDELDFAGTLLGRPTVVVTGTNGKSTTTVLIARMLEAAGHRVFCGGNLAPGRPLSDALGKPERDYYVVEASSFQLERSRWLKPRVAVILNLSPDHLNRHKTMARYAECKFRLLDLQDETGFAVINYDDVRLRSARKRGRAEKYYFSAKRRVRGAWLDRGWLRFGDERLVAASRLPVPGQHYVQNALAAIAAARVLGVSAAAVRKVLCSFTGLEHRLELVRVVDQVRYVNNSMCTNPAAGANSLAALGDKGRRRVVLIAGGREKGLPVAEYVKAIRRWAKHVVLLGENRARLMRAIGRQAAVELADDMKQAAVLARAAAGPGDVVLFSPGFASFDQFADFQARGRAFRAAVGRLRPRGVK